jgi:acyl-coenzyme A thioesterase PaaI-like protein
VLKSQATFPGEIVRLGKTLAVCRMEVHTAAKRLIATGAGTFMVTTVALE